MDDANRALWAHDHHHFLNLGALKSHYSHHLRRIQQFRDAEPYSLINVQYFMIM